MDSGPVRTVVKPCSLDPATQNLITNIFSKEMFKNAMTLMNLDVKKMPLGKLTKQQIARGFEALEALEEAMKNPTGDGQSLEELSSCFYTVIPHNFGRSRPPPINSPDVLQAKKDMLLVLADIELAQTLQAAPGEEEEKVEEVPHPLDRDYQLLRCQLQLLDSGESEYKVNSEHLPWRYPGSPWLAAFPPMCPDLRSALEQEDHKDTSPQVSHLWPLAFLLHRQYRPT